jgi:hypothetical protein
VFRGGKVGVGVIVSRRHVSHPQVQNGHLIVESVTTFDKNLITAVPGVVMLVTKFVLPPTHGSPPNTITTTTPPKSVRAEELNSDRFSGGLPHDKHHGFSKQVLRYHLKTALWTAVGELNALPVTILCMAWAKSWVIPSDEVCPSVR